MRKLFVAVWLALVALATGQDGFEWEARTEYRPPPPPQGDVYFYETFQDMEDYEERWFPSRSTKEGAEAGVAQYNGEWAVEAPYNKGSMDGEKGLVMKEAAKHYAISAKFDKPFVFSEELPALVLQYEVNFQEGLSCGGGYIKLLVQDEDYDPSMFNSNTPYSIMFGPDRCGQSSKIHFIIRYKNPVTGKIEEKHSKQPTPSWDFFSDKMTHLFALVLRSNSNYAILVDQTIILTGSLLEDLTPGIIPPEEISDPDDKKPADWDDRETIPEPGATKPDDWDEDAPQKIPDPDATKPEGWLDDGPLEVVEPDATKPSDWDDEEDGEWEAPMIPNPVCEDIGCGEWTPPMIANPNYKGKWRPPTVPNPDYQGKWEPRKITNPEYFEEYDPYGKLLPIGAIGLELWTMSTGIIFDNIVITTELTSANAFARASWTRKHESELEATGKNSLGPWVDYFTDLANDYPWMWALYVTALVAPFVICSAFCVRTRKPKPKDEAAIRKKTDAPSPDDPKAKEEQEREEKAEAAKKAAEVDDSKKDDEPSPEDTGEPPEEQPQHGYDEIGTCGLLTLMNKGGPSGKKNGEDGETTAKNGEPRAEDEAPEEDEPPPAEDQQDPPEDDQDPAEDKPPAEEESESPDGETEPPPSDEPRKSPRRGGRARKATRRED